MKACVKSGLGNSHDICLTPGSSIGRNEQIVYYLKSIGEVLKFLAMNKLPLCGDQKNVDKTG